MLGKRSHFNIGLLTVLILFSLLVDHFDFVDHIHRCQRSVRSVSPSFATHLVHFCFLGIEFSNFFIATCILAEIGISGELRLLLVVSAHVQLMAAEVLVAD